MRVLLDTHAAIWYGDSPRQIPSATLTVLNDPGNTILISIASAWETAIKAGVGKLRLSLPADAYYRRLTEVYEFGLLPITLQHIAGVQTLPLHHRDPFDRPLIAQSKSDGLTLVSADAAFDAYGITRLW